MISPLEIKRKGFHILAGILLIGLYLKNIITPFFFFVLLILASITCLLSLRYNIPIVWWFLVHFDRPRDRTSFPGKGAWFFVLGFFLATLLFEKNIALASMAVVTIGDALSYIIGVHFGQIKHPFSNRKFIEGHLSGALVSAFVASFFIPWWIGLLGAIAGMFMEGIDIVIGTDPIDDNVIVPLAAGSVMTLLSQL